MRSTSAGNASPPSGPHEHGEKKTPEPGDAEKRRLPREVFTSERIMAPEPRRLFHPQDFVPFHPAICPGIGNGSGRYGRLHEPGLCGSPVLAPYGPGTFPLHGVLFRYPGSARHLSSFSCSSGLWLRRHVNYGQVPPHSLALASLRHTPLQLDVINR